MTNPDRTAADQRRLLAAANLPLDVCLFWNAVPWDLNGRNPSSADLKAGAPYLAELVKLMARTPTIVACGNAAQNTCARARLDAIQICHPSDRGLRGGGVNREPAHLAGLKDAARRVQVRQPRPEFACAHAGDGCKTALAPRYCLSSGNGPPGMCARRPHPAQVGDYESQAFHVSRSSRVSRPILAGEEAVAVPLPSEGLDTSGRPAVFLRAASLDVSLQILQGPPVQAGRWGDQ